MCSWFRTRKVDRPTRRAVESGDGFSGGSTSFSRKEWRFLGGVLILSVLLLGSPMVKMGDDARGKEPQSQELTPEQVAVIESSIRRYTNEERRRRNLKPLQPSSALALVARGQSEHMCRANLLKHESRAFPKGWQKFSQRLSIVGVSAGGENIAFRTVTADPKRWARSIVRGWMNSPDHRRNILRSQFRYIGVGVQACENRLAYATQVFSPSEGHAPHQAGRK